MIRKDEPIKASLPSKRAALELVVVMAVPLVWGLVIGYMVGRWS